MLDLSGQALAVHQVADLAERIRGGVLAVDFIDLRRTDLPLASLSLLCAAVESARLDALPGAGPVWVELGDNPFGGTEAIEHLRNAGLQVCVPLRCGRRRCLLRAALHLSCRPPAKRAEAEAIKAAEAEAEAEAEACRTRRPEPVGPKAAPPRVRVPVSEAESSEAPPAPAHVVPKATAGLVPCEATEFNGRAADGSVVSRVREAVPIPLGPMIPPQSANLLPAGAPGLQPWTVCPLVISAPVMDLGAEQSAFALCGPPGRQGGRQGGQGSPQEQAHPFEEVRVIMASPMSMVGLGRVLVHRLSQPCTAVWVDVQSLVSDPCSEHAFALLASTGDVAGILAFIDRAVCRLGGRVCEPKAATILAQRIADSAECRGGSWGAAFQELLILLHDQLRRQAAGIWQPGDTPQLKAST